MRPSATKAAVRFAACTVAAVLASPTVQADTPAFAAVRAAHAPSDLPVLDRHGATVQWLRVDARVRRLAWVPLSAVSPALRAAIVVSEDQRFWAHAGVDWRGLARSAVANAQGVAANGGVQGASTLTMQLAALLNHDLARPAGGRSVGQKLSQMAQALALETTWSKEQVFEAYLNRVPLRGELVGVNAGAQMLFGKHPRGLDMLESATLAALVRAPQADEATVQRRACGVLQAQGWACDGLGSVVARALVRRGGPVLGPALAPHAARLAWRQSVGLGGAQPQALSTTLDAGLQRVAVDALAQQLAGLRGRHVNDGAVVVLDNASGEVRAWVGSAGAAFSDAAAVDAVLARRQPGSALKPFVYGLAFEEGLLTAESRLQDAPTRLPAGAGLYVPGNYDGGYRGWVSARIALASSLNIPAVQVGALLSPDLLFQRLNGLGLGLSESAGYHGLALALGSAEVTLIELTNAYRALAQGGQWTPWRLQAGAGSVAATATPRRAMDPAAAALVGEILADNSARAPTFGLDSPLVTRGFAAVKTGTSKDLRDNWCVGYSARYTVGVWVGNAAGEPMQQVSGTTGAAPVWRTLLAHLHATSPSRPPAASPGLTARIDRLRGVPLPAGADRAAGAFVAGIRHPREGHRFAIDPDVPPALQRVVFEGEAGVWWLDGRRLGVGERLAWAPWPGRHRLELRDGRGGVLDAVDFEVRGAQLRPRPLPPPAQRNMRSSAASMTTPHTL